ncbi:MAG: ThiF family adenylyltransferase [Polyangiales bacterium]
MPTLPTELPAFDRAAGANLASARVLVVGLGGLGCPGATALLQSGIGQLTLLDDDHVELDNLHRQTLFAPADVGARKAEVAQARLRALARAQSRACRIEAKDARLTPDNAAALLQAHDLVFDGSDNYATKYLVADWAAALGKPAVQGGVQRWQGWALLSQPGQGGCLRCLFGAAPNVGETSCGALGVVGPVVGVIAGLQALLAVACLATTALQSQWLSYDGQRDRLQQRPLAAVARCGCERRQGNVAWHPSP